MSDKESESFAKLDPDIIYEEIGGFGRFQIIVYTLICLPLVFIACCNFSYIFIAGDLEYRCLIPECDGNVQNGTTEWINKAVPYANGKISKCERFSPVSLNSSDNSFCPWSYNQSDVMQCEKFMYLTDERMLINEFNLTCQNEWKLTLVGSLGYLAECFALPFIGLIADKYGRRPTLICSFVLVSIFGIAKTFSSNYITFLILHFIGAFFGGGAFALVFVLGSEVVGPSSRGFGAGLVSSSVSCGQIMLAIVIMFISDFRILLRLLFGLVAFGLTFIWFVPESVRWLLTVGKYKEGLRILQNVAKMNGFKIPVETVNALSKHSENNLLIEDNKEANRKIEKYPMAQALKSKVLLMRLMICCFCYFTNALIYYGLSVYSSSLPGDGHMNLLYAGIVEIPGNGSTCYVVRRFGRKRSLMMAMLMCSLACIATEILPNPTMKIIFFLVGKFAVALSYTILNLYSIELFPTNLRQSMFNICMIFAGCGNILAPQMPLMKKMIPSLPLILFGGTSFSSALLVLLLPETKNKSMPDNVEEAINM